MVRKLVRYYVAIVLGLLLTYILLLLYLVWTFGYAPLFDTHVRNTILFFLEILPPTALIPVLLIYVQEILAKYRNRSPPE